MRLFVAINFNEETKKGLVTLRDGLRVQSERGRFSALENLHLTLAFLGECSVSQTNEVKAVMDELEFKPFTISIDRIGRFKRAGGDIWWAGVREDKKLLKLQRELTDGLCAIGFVLDKRKYNPHITLGREIVTDASPRPIKPFGETVSCIELMKSEHISGKLTYTDIYSKGALS